MFYQFLTGQTVFSSSLKAANIKKGDEVIVPNLTFFIATITPIIGTGRNTRFVRC